MSVLTNNTKLIADGWNAVFITSNWYCFDDTTGQGDYDLSHVSNAAMDRAAIKLTDYVGPILLDIECFDLRNDFENAVRNLRHAVMRWKSANPTRLIGLYECVPERNFWAPVNANIIRTSEWNREKMERARIVEDEWKWRNNQVSSALVPHMDFLCPSLYAFTPSYDRYWMTYAEANLSEAFRVSQGKPVWPIHWPKYHDSTQPMRLDMWRKMCEFIASYPGVETWIAYAPDETALPNGWDEVVKQTNVELH